MFGSSFQHCFNEAVLLRRERSPLTLQALIQPRSSISIRVRKGGEGGGELLFSSLLLMLRRLPGAPVRRVAGYSWRPRSLRADLSFPRFQHSADGHEKSCKARRHRAVNAGKSVSKRGSTSQRAVGCLFVFLVRLCFCFSRLLVCDTVTARERWLGTRGACWVPACCGLANQELEC